MKNLIILFVFLITNCSVFSKEILFDVDINQYNYNEDSVLVEIYYCFDQSSLYYTPRADSFMAKLNISAEIKSNIQTHFSEKWYFENISETSNPASSYMVGIKQIFLPKGEYTLNLSIEDFYDSTSKADLSSVLLVSGYSKNKLLVSDLLIAYNIEDEKNRTFDWSEMFFRNGLYVVPNPKKEIVGTEPVLNLYFEIYNSTLIEYDSLIARFNVYNSMRNKVFEYKKHLISTVSNFRDFTFLMLDTLASGVYYVELLVEGRKDDFADSALTSKKFFLINPLIKPHLNTYFTEDELFSRSEFASMENEQIEDEFEKSKIIASNAEADVWDRLTEASAKRHYLYSFWAKRRADTSKFINSYRETFKENIEFANKFYREKYGEGKGWKSDRGRILLKYGKPTQIEQFQAEDGKNAYEQWSYDVIQGGIQFYFVDARNTHSFRLVHSTATNEVFNERWYEQYVTKSNQNPNTKTNSNSNSNSNSNIK